MVGDGGGVCSLGAQLLSNLQPLKVSGRDVCEVMNEFMA